MYEARGDAKKKHLSKESESDGIWHFHSFTCSYANTPVNLNEYIAFHVIRLTGDIRGFLIEFKSSMHASIKICLTTTWLLITQTWEFL